MKIIEKILKQKFDKNNNSVATTAVAKIIKIFLSKISFKKIIIYAIIAIIIVVIAIAGLIALTVWLVGSIIPHAREVIPTIPQIEEMIPAIPQIEEVVPGLIDAGTFIEPEIGAGLEELDQELRYIGDAIDQVRP